MKFIGGWPQIFVDTAGSSLPFDISQLEPAFQEALTGTIVLRGGKITIGDGIAPNFVLVKSKDYRLQQEADPGSRLAHCSANVILDWTWVEECVRNNRFLGVEDNWAGRLVANRATYWQEAESEQAAADAEFAASFQRRMSTAMPNGYYYRNPHLLPQSTTLTTNIAQSPSPSLSPPPSTVKDMSISPEPESENTQMVSSQLSPTIAATSPEILCRDFDSSRGHSEAHSSNRSQSGDQSSEPTQETSPRPAKRKRLSPPPSTSKKPKTSPKRKSTKTSERDVLPQPGPSNSNKLPVPPKQIQVSGWFGNEFTADDERFMREYIDLICTAEYEPDFRAMFKEMATRAPHHTAASWKKFFYKHEAKFASEIASLARLYESSSSEDEGEDDDNEKPATRPIKTKRSSISHSATPPSHKSKPKTAVLLKEQTKPKVTPAEAAITDQERRALVQWMADAPAGVDEAELLQNFAHVYTRHSWRTWQVVIKNHKESFARAIARRRNVNALVT